ncbi:delta-12 fatty acid desaturase protein [Peniophora sp. CONT]|nr:delta-12 fatty acid desaturase protein [Peniophora sp. CONT]
MFSNGPEYDARLRKAFVPPTATLKDIHSAVPKELLRKQPLRATAYVIRDVTFSLAFFVLATRISSTAQLAAVWTGSEWLRSVAKVALWGAYWWFQGLLWAGIFCLGECFILAGHGSLFHSTSVNNTVGFTLHSFLLIPYFAWRSTHHAHHARAPFSTSTGSIERDENYVPYHRDDFGLPPKKEARRADYAEVFEETPLFTLLRVLIMQGMGWWLYLSQNTLGAKMYPPGTNHFDPRSPLFKDHERASIFWSDIGIACMAILLIFVGREYGWTAVLVYYGVPYLLTNHWIVMFTYLHHSDPTIAHYYASEWTFLRGAAATVDRPLLGWMGRFFLHNISHDHVAHHFFVGAPFFNGPEITKHVREVLQGDYNYDSTNTAYALWRSFTQCLFIEDEHEAGGIVFYKNKHGEQARQLAPDASRRLQSMPPKSPKEDMSEFVS